MSQCKYCGEEVKDRCEHKKTAEGTRVIDREKVLKGLKHCAGMEGLNCNGCPYYFDKEIHTVGCCKLYADAAALIESDIKKTAPVIRYKKEYYGNDNTLVGRLTCGFCGKDISSRDHFCKSCGMEVDWDAEDYAWRRDAPGGTGQEGG